MAMQAPDADGIDFIAATSQMIAYERDIESKREDRLFNDHLAKHFIGIRGEQVSAFLNTALGDACGIKDVHIPYTAARTKLINDHLESWINTTTEKGQKV